MKKVIFNEEPIAGYTASYEGRSSAANPGELVRLILTREPGVREVIVDDYGKKYRLRSLVFSAPSGEGYQCRIVDLALFASRSVVAQRPLLGPALLVAPFGSSS